MELIRSLHNLKPNHRGCVATIGNFDGVHLGHQAIVRQLLQAAHQKRLPALVILFEPQPKEYFCKHPQEAPIRLQRLSEKLHQLDALGVDRVLCIRFSKAFRHYTREKFVQTLLVEQLGVRHLIIGDDFRFGHDRSGDFKYLQDCAKHFDFSLERTPTLNHKDGYRISSTGVRRALQQSNLELAKTLLGRPYSLTGKVVHGRKLGRTLGFPTANIFIKRTQLPMAGVFLVEVKDLSSTPISAAPLPGVANLGYKPSIQGDRVASLEVHLLLAPGEHPDCYHHRFEVRFLKKIRDEQKFDSLEALQQQVQTDIAAARAEFLQYNH